MQLCIYNWKFTLRTVKQSRAFVHVWWSAVDNMEGGARGIKEVQMVDRPNTTPIGQDKNTLTFKALL